MKLGIAHFRSLLVVSCLSFAVENLMDLTDMAIAGNLLGETGLAAVELYGVMTEFLYFAGIIVANGSANFFAAAAGRFDKSDMSRWFSNGLVFAIACGAFCSLVSLFLCKPYLSFVGVGGATLAQARSYWLWYVFQAFVQPLAVYLAALVYADADRATCTAAFSLEFLVNAAASYFLCRTWGIAGCSVGTAIGSLSGVAVLLTHFFRKDNSLVFRWRFSVRDAWRVVHDDFSESGCALYLVVIGALMNYLLAQWFGDQSLAVLAIVVMVCELLLFLDGIPNASRALVGVYVAEGNFPVVRDLAREGLRWSFGLGSAVGTLLLAFPSLPVRILGVGADSPVWDTCLVAVRLIGVSCFFHGLLLYYISYLLFIGRTRMSLALSLLSQNLFPVIGFVLGGWLFGEIGFWTGYAMAGPAACAVFLLVVTVRSGCGELPYFLPTRTDETICNDSAFLTPEEICRLSHLTRERLRAASCEPRDCVRAALVVEESLMETFERNGGRRVRAEVTLNRSNASIRIILRDDGVPPARSGETAVAPDSIRRHVLGRVSKSLSKVRDLTAIGINKREFSL